MNIRGKTILLTGATGGIGQAIAHRLASEGAVLILVGRSVTSLQQLAANLDLHRTKGFVLEADIATHAGREKIRTALIALSQPVDALINCAGISLFGLLPDNEPEAIENVIATNVTATVLLTRLVLPYLHRQQGRIITIGSSFGGLGYPGFAVYCATKFALRGFSEALRREMQTDESANGNVQVAYLAPRATQTAINSDAVCAMNRELGNAMDEPEVVAFAVEKMLRATQMRDRNIGWPERLFLRINSIFPSIIDGALRKQLPIIRRYAKANSHGSTAALTAGLEKTTQPSHS
ncbi:short chain dehydrogenase [Cellvibrio mixtus]|uniref:Short chain dehydrogenase n=1 Tax=Cellvibrio mixtus TaxID=39650 RepID=A0A266QA37_9GAMM|nr:SDR family oxidoreductase [Cellvibrio mixtus]OZY86690.1 short chain dehydrogenase [Cellvibrio mixtus]